MRPSPPVHAQQPHALVPLIEAIAPAHRAFNQRAMRYGDRYRSAFWAIYLLIALAVQCAGLPLALGVELGKIIEPVKATLGADDPLATAELLRGAVVSAVSLILDEHQDWHMLVRPHHLPLG